MIVFLIFLVLGFFLTLYYIVRKIDPMQEEKVFDKVSLSMKIHNEFTKLLKSGELLIPKGLFISNGHIWYKALPDGKIRIGIDDFPLKLLGEIHARRITPVIPANSAFAFVIVSCHSASGSESATIPPPA